MIDILTAICNKIWKTGEWPTTWTQSIVITLPKKGNLQLCQNYRTISLISHPSKVMLKIILNRLQPQAEEIIPEEQTGFRAGRSTTEQIFNLRIHCEKYLQHQQNLYHVFIDFKKAFDRVWHEALWATMRKCNINASIIRAVENLYDMAKSAVLFNGSTGEWFRTIVGVLQGCLLSPKEKYFNGHSDTRSVQENFDLLTSFIQDSADKHIPSKTSRSVSSIPWITPEIRRKICRKNKTHAKAKKTGSSKLRSKFETLRREIKADVRKQHDLYVNNLVGDVKANPRDFYRYINSQKKDTQGIPPLKRKNGKGVAQSDLEKAEEFNGQFTDVFSKNEHTKVPLLDRSAPFMNDIAVSKDGLIKLLKGLNPSKALGPDELHPRVLKELATELGPVFAHFFQQSIDTGEIPKEWSLANIFPLFKKSDSSLACNYRPVSLTCVPCKLLEHIVCSNIMAHLDEYKLLSDRQHAFRKGHSCETQLTTVINDLAKILDNRGQVDTFILDFENAFDTPPHELLKSKLFSYGIGGKTLKWIGSFLCFRQQRVVVNGVKSDWAPVLSGVPQGTVLGPLLFSLYINDISSDIESEIRLIADDCVCYREIKDEKDTMKLQRDIDRLGSWARKWGMRFQPVKCNMMQLTRKRIKKIHASYTLEGTNLENVESIKYLGVTITSDLRWNTHVSNVCTKANRTLGFLRRNLYSCPQEVKDAAYKALVRPVLDYGSSVWDPPGVVLQEELESVQKRAARFVTGNYNYETGSMTGILGQLKWESLKKRRKDNRLILLYKGLKGKASVPTDDLIPKTRRCRKQHTMAFQTPIANTDVYKGSFFPQTIRDWNALPDSLISSAEDAEDCVAKFTSLVRARD